MRLSLKKFFTSIGSIVFWLLLIILCYLSFSPVPLQQSPETIKQKIKALHETAAIWVPHLEIDDGKVRQAHQPLFEKVEQGQLLTSIESQEYRQLYQSLLLDNQKKFSLFDSQLEIVNNLGMDQPNNIGGKGVEGHHDHHDQSSRNNFSEIEASFDALNNYSHQKHVFFSVNRVKHAISIYKNLNDILFHLATVPHTKSIHYHPRTGDLSSEQHLFESILLHFKAAQFTDINSERYKAKIALALDEYHLLVSISEIMVHQNLSPIELKVVGNWGGRRSLTPKISERVKQE